MPEAEIAEDEKAGQTDKSGQAGKSAQADKSPQAGKSDQAGKSGQVDGSDPIFQRVEDQLAWYSQKSRSARRAFKRIKVTEIIAAALIPFLTGRSWLNISYVIGGLGVLITVLEGILHLNQYQENWSSYRSTAESLKHEKFLFLAKAGPYNGAIDLRVTLAERVEAIVSQENSQWVTNVQKASASKSN